jgi:hypothetical protein
MLYNIMPKDNIKYTDTIIYKICCKDETITDLYVGHTTNFHVRKYQHKTASKNTKDATKIYKTIRENGGWDNWNMVEIVKYACSNATEARIKEQEYYEMLKANLNSIPPYGSKKHTCNNTTSDLVNNATDETKIETDNEKSQKNCCKLCDYKTSKSGDFKKHLLTNKHKKAVADNKKNKESNYKCDCGKVYKYDSGYYRHKKKCDGNKNVPNIITTELFMELIKDNKELQQTLIEQNKTIIELAQKSGNYTTNTNYGNISKTFNLQFFLNEQCKDAMNLSEFVTSVTMELSDLEETGRLGYVEGVSRIINKNLNMLDVYKRPIHCSDLKRETLYIKNDDEWKKEGDGNSVIIRAIKDVANENIKQICEWRKAHPGCSEANSNKNDFYLKIVSNAMSGSTREEQMTNYEKIVSKIAKEVVIVK